MSFLIKDKNTQYEAQFSYAKGSLAITPHSWHEHCWGCLREEMLKDTSVLLGDRKNRVLVVGLGDGGILPQLKLKNDIEAVGVDINREFLVKSKDYCDLVVASASHLPIKKDSFDMVFFELVLHHLKGQMNLSIPLGQAYDVLAPNGKVVAVEPNALHPSGFLMNLINVFHSYSRLFGGSDYEYSLTAKELKVALKDFTVKIDALSFLQPRFPLSVQLWILRNNRFFMKWLSNFAWVFMVVGCKI